MILKKLASLGIELSITTNAVLVDKYIGVLKECEIKAINVSLDTLSREKFTQITRRNEFERVYKNMLLLIKEGFKVKLTWYLLKALTKMRSLTLLNYRSIILLPFASLSSCLLMEINGI